MNLLVVTQEPFSSAVRFYRTQGPCSQFPAEINVTVKSTNDVLSSEAWAWGMYDVLLCEKYWTQEGATIISIAKSYGMKIWVDVDDDKHNIPAYNNAARKWNDNRKKLDLAVCGMSDLLTVSTDALRKLYAPVNKNILVVRNAWNDYLLPPANVVQQGRPIKMAWRGGQRHGGDLEDVRKPLAAALNNQAFRWKFHGADPPPWVELSENMHQEMVPLHTWWSNLRVSAPDWLFVPLRGNPFNRAKSDGSAIEGNMLAGAGVIAPMHLPEFNHPGVLRYKDNAHLLQIWKQIEKQPDLKAETVKEGQEYITAERRLSQENNKRIEALKAIL